MYLTILISIVILLWLIYFIQSYTKNTESFTPKINSMYRPYIRQMNQHYETFKNNYSPHIIVNKLKKWNIY